MAIWGTARPLYARVEIGQDREDLLVRFEVGQDAQDFPAIATIKSSDISELFARLEVVHSQELPGRAVIRQKNIREFLGEGIIRHSDLVELQAQADIMHWIVLYCKFEVGRGAANLAGKVEIRKSSFAELFGKVEIYHSVDLFAKSQVQQSVFTDLFTRFEVGQDNQGLLARFEVSQGAVDLPGEGKIRQLSSVEILCKLSIPASRDLFARFRLRQETLDLLGRFIASRRGYVQNLPAFFAVGQNHEDLWGSMISQHSAQFNLDGEFIIKHADTVEFYGHGIIKNASSAEAYAYLTVTNTGVQELFCRFNIGDIRDLFCRFVTGVKDSMVVFAIDNLMSFLTYVEGVGAGFISEPQVEDDGSEKMVGLNSFKITSNYEAGGYKEIKFGWKRGAFLPPAPAYVNLVGEIWMLDVGGYLVMEGEIGLYVDDPEGWGGAYFNR